jgi:multicomponent Na+:H+ antiporter subunit E
MIGYLNLILRLSIWFLLTSDLSLPNIVIGVIIALLLPHNHKIMGTLKDWVQALLKIVLAIPIAYIEAVEMILRPHNAEDIILEQVRPNRSLGLIFLDIFLITFTPKTIVVRCHDRGSYEIHRVKRRRQEP